MGTRMMGSHGGGGGNGGIQHPKSDGLSKQGLLYNLTLDEVQHQLGDLGKPLSSMNLDELLKSVYTAESEAYQGMPGGSGLLAAGPSMADLSKKTVDELWQDIQGQKKKDINISDSNCHNLDKKSTHEKEQGTLGEMTLEDFLAKAGIVAKSASVVESESIALTPQQNSNPQIAQWIQYQIPPAQQQQQVFMPGHHQVQHPMSPSPLMGSLSDTQAPGRKRLASGDVTEKTVERRQKRMIKNRESAARSRARKQAYTHELEYKVSRLEEENERLKREQEAEKALPCAPLPEPKYQLRRTSSAHI